ncbi:hypothetical protein K503DRAFT_870918 [Rhizopogon vinicolor AM-OR11-026]|uniref:Uncharacterized protein n=1 Tax=Rhizopogon vinicolor AM-OR11-026 TaxID=1314800 RepID=A0A1B7MDM5_9AGAM|nr:hypothetical protein K503DRAFT_870918 [Rhizopogon vinicolor AM-OR11-026]
MSTSVPTVLGWRDDIFGSSDMNIDAIMSFLPLIIQFPGLSSAGLSNATLYDIPETGSIVGNATVNATTITSHCHLLPNVTYNATNSQAGALSSNGYTLDMTASAPWPDQIQILQSEVRFSNSENSQIAVGGQFSVFFMISTSLEVNASVQMEASVPTTWQYQNNSIETPYDVEIYFVQCPLSAVTEEAVVDMQTYSLQNPVPISQPSTQWEMYQWTSDNNTWQGQSDFNQLNWERISVYVYRWNCTHQPALSRG